MKTKHFFSLLAFSCLAMSSQAQYYQFGHQNSTYEEFNDGIELDKYQISSDFLDTLNSDFYIHVFEDSTNELIVGESFVWWERSGGLEGTQLFPLWYLSWINESTTISFKTVGVTGSRILKIQYEDLGFSAIADTNYYTNHQVWFYEGEDKVEFHYGPMNIPTSGDLYINDDGFNTFCPGVLILLADIYNSDQLTANSAHVYNEAADPLYDQFFSATSCAYQGFPNNGDIYQFYRSNLSVDDQSLFEVKIKQPNASTVLIESEMDLISDVVVRSIDGKVLTELNDLKSNTVNINLDRYTQQVLFLEVMSINGKRLSRKIVF